MVVTKLDDGMLIHDSVISFPFNLTLPVKIQFKLYGNTLSLQDYTWDASDRDDGEHYSISILVFLLFTTKHIPNNLIGCKLMSSILGCVLVYAAVNFILKNCGSRQKVKNP